MSFLEALKSRILIGDGAMGTLLYANGIDNCYEELNVSNPEQVLRVHESYKRVGADVIQTNTYGANAIKLARYGLGDSVREINRLGVRLAKQGAGKDGFVVGTIGGIRGINKSIATMDEILSGFSEQLDHLLSEAVDGVLLETYYDLEELKEVLIYARRQTEKPIIAQVSLHEVGKLQDGTGLAEALHQLEELGANVVGLNCRLGPFHMIQALKQVPLPKHAFLSAYPNASFPDYEDGRIVFKKEAAYFEEVAMGFRNEGVRLLGGCCGTTPEHIEAMADTLRGVAPLTEKHVKTEQVPQVERIQIKSFEHPSLHETVKQRRSVIVELDPPKQLNVTKFLEGARALKKAGIDALTMADNSLASPRVSNMAMAAMVKEQFNLRPLVHITCRDRNLIGLESHLMGLHALGINQVLAVTGDPAKIGDFPGASSVFDVSSFELIELMKKMNKGISYSGKSLGEATQFSIAAAFNPNVNHLDRAVQRMEKKIAAGADYFISQPLYSEEQILRVYEATKHIEAPIYIGIMPLTSSRNAEFLHNEVPGIKLSTEIRNQMAAVAHDPALSRAEGLTISKSLIDAAFDLFNGIYLITPFMRYDLTVELTNYIHIQESTKAGREIING